MEEEKLKKHIYVNILCGGGGTRLWPSSRKKTPKQFIPLFGKESIFHETIKRALKITSADKIYVTTNADYADEVLQQGKVILPRNIIAEPEKKNTALAMGIASILIQKQDSQAIVANLTSDHLISSSEKFAKDVLVAAKSASMGDFLVTVGIKPASPHTGYGYIKTAGEFEKVDGVSVKKVSRFTEKPSLEKAKQFLRAGGYFWNAGLYIWKVDSMMKAFKKYAPKTATLLEKMGQAFGGDQEAGVMKSVYKKAESISIDYAIAEKAKNMLLVPSSFDWSDVGDWKVVYDVSEKDSNKNSVLIQKKGELISLGTKNCLVRAGGKLVATIGLEDLIIIDMSDALLVCRKDRAQDVKKVVNLLKEEGKTEYL